MALERLDTQNTARRAAAEIVPGSVVAVSGAWSVAAADLVPDEKGVWLMRAGGMLADLPINAADAGALLRAGYVDLSILTAAQVDSNGSFAGYHATDYPGPQGHAGLIDLTGARRVVTILPHTGEDGTPNVVSTLSLPPDGVRCVDAIITDAAVFRVADEGLILTEVAPGWSAEDVRDITGAAITVAPALREMDFTLPPGKPPSKVYADGPSAIADLPDGATVFIDGFGGPGRHGSLPPRLAPGSRQPQPDHRQQHRRHRPCRQLRYAARSHRH